MDQTRSIQRLLAALKLLPDTSDGQSTQIVQAAIRDYQRMAGLEETGEASPALFASLTEMVALVAPNFARKGPVTK
jgi:peptidoglycan hydrolase-like protein with peptidoglycan-binding domain